MAATHELSLHEIIEEVTGNSGDSCDNEEDTDEDRLQEAEKTYESETGNFLDAKSAAYAVMKRSLETRVSCGLILTNESRLWLAMIKRRLSGRRRIRNPFTGEISRDIPWEIFEALRSAIASSTLSEFNEPNCYIADNKKVSMISLTSNESVINLFAFISGYITTKVEEFFCRNLKSKGRAELIVNENKDFAMIYKLRTGQFFINFHFGLWNMNNFPLHT